MVKKRAIKFRIITKNVKSVKCNKCGHKVNHFFKRVCKPCYNERMNNKRKSDFLFRYCVLSSWQDFYDKCSLCGEELIKKDSMELCASCVDSLHPDSSHYASGTGPGWGHEKPVTSSAYPCMCGGVQVIEVEKGSLRYFYYKVGNKSKIDQPYVCEWLESINNFRARGNCFHDYIEILSTANIGAHNEEADKSYRKLKKNNNLEWFVDGEIAQDIYERQAYGETHLWCWKCGAYYVPTGKPNFIPPAIGWGEET